MSEVPVRDAATVMLVRDGADGLEVLMVRRTPSAAFAGGFLAFPGGAVEPGDSDVEPLCVGRTDAEASRLLGIDNGGLAFWVAAIRESFEEAGVLYAYTGDNGLLALEAPEAADRFRDYRTIVHERSRSLADVCRAEGLQLAVDALHYFSHWITPPGPPRRFDTRFFVARAPDGQEPLHDDRELVDSFWVRPDDALARHDEQRFPMLAPTMHNLRTLARFTSADELLDIVSDGQELPMVEGRWSP